MKKIEIKFDFSSAMDNLNKTFQRYGSPIMAMCAGALCLPDDNKFATSPTGVAIVGGVLLGVSYTFTYLNSKISFQQGIQAEKDYQAEQKRKQNLTAKGMEKLYVPTNKPEFDIRNLDQEYSTRDKIIYKYLAPLGALAGGWIMIPQPSTNATENAIFAVTGFGYVLASCIGAYKNSKMSFLMGAKSERDKGNMINVHTLYPPHIQR